MWKTRAERERERGEMVNNEKQEWEEMMDGWREERKDEWHKIFPITRRNVVLMTLESKDNNLKKSCDHPDKVTLSQVIFNWKSLLSSPRLQQGEKNIRSLMFQSFDSCFTVLINVSHGGHFCQWQTYFMFQNLPSSSLIKSYHYKLPGSFGVLKYINQNW